MIGAAYLVQVCENNETQNPTIHLSLNEARKNVLRRYALHLGAGYSLGEGGTRFLDKVINTQAGEPLAATAHLTPPDGRPPVVLTITTLEIN